MPVRPLDRRAQARRRRGPDNRPVVPGSRLQGELPLLGQRGGRRGQRLHRVGHRVRDLGRRPAGLPEHAAVRGRRPLPRVSRRDRPAGARLQLRRGQRRDPADTRRRQPRRADRRGPAPGQRPEPGPAGGAAPALDQRRPDEPVRLRARPGDRRGRRLPAQPGSRTAAAGGRAHRVAGRRRRAAPLRLPSRRRIRLRDQRARLDGDRLLVRRLDGSADGAAHRLDAADGFDGTNYPADIHVSPSGKFLYGSNRGHHSIAFSPSTGDPGC